MDRIRDEMARVTAKITEVEAKIAEVEANVAEVETKSAELERQLQGPLDESTKSEVWPAYILHQQQLTALLQQIAALLQQIPSLRQNMVHLREQETFMTKNQAVPYIPIETTEFVRQIGDYLFYEIREDGAKCCFTIVADRVAVSFAHGHHARWKAPSEGQSGTEVYIYNQAGRKFKTTVLAIDSKMDIVAVVSEDVLVSTLPAIKLPSKLERYVLLGYPNSKPEYQALEGIFSCVGLDDHGRMRGSSGSLRGYSGGPIFNYAGDILGINVANVSFPKSLDLTKPATDLLEEAPSVYPPLSVIVPVYYCASSAQANGFKCQFKP